MIEEISQPQLRATTNTPQNARKLWQFLMSAMLEASCGKQWECATEVKTDVNKCLRAQRLEKTKENREAAKIKNQEIRAKWAEIDSNS